MPGHLRAVVFSVTACCSAAILLAQFGCDLGRSMVSGGGGKDYFEIAESGDRKLLQAAEGYYLALTENDFSKAYDLMSPWASKDVNPNQFLPEESDKDPVRSDITKQEFVDQLQQLVNRTGKFRDIDLMYVESTDPRILAGETQDKWELIDVMYAIGMMSPEVPTDIRKASIRATISLEMEPELAKQMAAEYGYSSVEEMYEDGESPYLTVKTVLVEEDGQLKVGYFEFIPPSMLD